MQGGKLRQGAEWSEGGFSVKKLPNVCEELQDEIYLTFEEDSRREGVYYGYCELGKCSVMFFAAAGEKPTLRRQIKMAMQYMCSRCERSLK